MFEGRDLEGIEKGDGCVRDENVEEGIQRYYMAGKETRVAWT